MVPVARSRASLGDVRTKLGIEFPSPAWHFYSHHVPKATLRPDIVRVTNDVVLNMLASIREASVTSL